jgi:hypothetical protein
MSLSDPLVIIVIALAAVTVLLVAASVVLALRVRRLVADQQRAFEGGAVDVIATVARQRERLDAFDSALDVVRSHARSVEAKADRGLSRIGVVRYDAFDDIGGQLSFSAAMLDEHADGVVLTSITGRSGGRSYLKSVTGGVGASPLSDEESAAVTAARDELRTERTVEQGKRRWRER